MSDTSRQRLLHVLHEPDGDLAEAALLCCVEVEPDLDVDAELARLDAMAEELRATGFIPGTPETNAEALTDLVAGQHGFTGDVVDYHNPRNGLLTSVLDRRQGLPIALAVVYIGVARRLGIHAHGINTPGHFLVGVAGARSEPLMPPVVVDPFTNGEQLSDEQIDERVRQATGGQAGYQAEHLREVPPALIIRRLLNNLTRDFLHEGDAEDALWTVELKRLLPDTGQEDVATHARLLHQLGRYRDAADAIDAYLADEAPTDEDHTDLEALSRRSRAQLN